MAFQLRINFGILYYNRYNNVSYEYIKMYKVKCSRLTSAEKYCVVYILARYAEKV